MIKSPRLDSFVLCSRLDLHRLWRKLGVDYGGALIFRRGLLSRVRLKGFYKGSIIGFYNMGAFILGSGTLRFLIRRNPTRII